MRKNVLLVDDDPHILELVTLFLSQQGFAVRVERDGFAAINSLEGNYFDLMLLDISMPHMSGLRVLKVIRQNHDLRHMRIIILTGSGSHGDLVKAKSFGVDDYLLKPPKEDDLIKRIEKVLARTPKLEEVLPDPITEEAQGQLTFPIQVTSVSKRGLVIRSIVPAAKGQVIQDLQLDLFKDLHLEKFYLNVTDCTPLKDGGYEWFLSFVNLNYGDQQKIQDWIETKTLEKLKMVV